MDSQITLIAAITLVVLLCLVAAWAVWSSMKKKRAQKLHEKFGPEYDAARQRYGQQTDTKLEERIKRVQQLNVRPLTREQGERFEMAWRTAMSRFIDDPALAVAEADRLVKDIMEARGYPITDFERRVGNISVDHPQVAQEYRIAHSIAKKSKVGQATTEEMRESMVHFRAMFQELLAVPAPEMQQMRS